MSSGALRHSLRAKLLVAVILCAVAPLAAVGVWLSSSAMRSAESLLRSQLDSAAARAAADAAVKWEYRVSDVALLADNAPLRAALLARAAPDSIPSYVQRAFATMPGIVDAVIRDADHRVHWSLGNRNAAEVPFAGGRDGVNQTGAATVPMLSLTAAVRNNSTGRELGVVEAHVALQSLAPATQRADVAPSQFVALHDRTRDRWLLPAAVPPSLVAQNRFDWNGHRWLAAHRRLERPDIDVVAAAELDPVLAPFTRTARVGASALALAALVVVVLTIVVTARLTTSLGDLAVAADRVARGDLATRVDVNSPDEVGRVAVAFNAMLDTLRRTMAELSQREAVAAMGELAATLAHQVRSPATAMRLDLERARDKLPSDSTARALLARALGQLERLERAVTGSLQVARSTRADFTPVDVRLPLRSAFASAQRDHRARDVHFIDRIPREGEWVVRGDAPSLEQMFSNLLTNAAQAVTPGGRVDIALECAPDGHAIVSIADDGAGMPADILARAGEPMFSTKPQGTGLGIAIAKRIASAHGGSIEILSEQSTGTTVRIRLPAEPSQS